jgi:hypothetical protein
VPYPHATLLEVIISFGTRYDVIFCAVAADGVNNDVCPAGWSPEMRRTDYRTLINRGRKAGLQTADLYNALAGQRPEAGDRNWRETDGNGFVSGVDSHGQNIFHPADNH